MYKEKFGTCKNGRTAYLYTIYNEMGMSARISDFGAVIVNLFVKDKLGVPRDIVMGYDTLAEYEVNTAYFGAAIGRCANRIKGGTFTIDGIVYKLDCNNGINHLHGGFEGFGKKLWNTEQIAENSLKLTLFSPDGDQKYPGNLMVSIIYTITNDNALEITYRGFCDKTTLFNMTNHAYFNLAGQDTDTILGHELCINADTITAVDENMSITGELMSVEGTPLDFRKMKKIGRDIKDDHPQIRYVKGFDHNYALNETHGLAAAEAYCDESGIYMSIYTDQPGIQLYTGNYLDSNLTIKGNKNATQYRAFCLETQFFPDAINYPNFISPTIKAGEYVEHTTRYIFSIR